ncbi:MAG: sensor histidine kinase [Actinomycetota bacterium]
MRIRKRKPGGVLRNLPLFSKLMVPFFTLILLLGVVGGFITIHDLSSRAQASVDEALLIRSLDTRSVLRDRELYLLESSQFASNVSGMAVAVHNGDANTAMRLLNSVRSLKSDLEFAAVLNGSGRVIAGDDVPSDVVSIGFVHQALIDTSGRRFSGVVQLPAGEMFVVASAICSRVSGCGSVGASLVGLSARAIAKRLVDSSASATMWGTDGSLIAESGKFRAPSPPKGGQTVRYVGTGSKRIATAYVPLVFGSSRVGTVGITISTAAEFASARRAARNLALVLVAALIGIVSIGALLTRLILAQVKPLVETNRSLGAGDFSARAPVLGSDELGELAQGVNQMAEQLQANVETLELRVEQRTDEIRRLLDERTEFFASLSHEFRTPLAVILAQAKMTQTQKRSASQVARSWEIVNDSASQLLVVVNDILELAKAETGHLDVTTEQLDLTKMLSDMEPTLRALGEHGGVSVKVHVPRKKSLVNADPVRLREVILNLVDNAVKYSPAGRSVDISTAEQNAHVDIAIRDYGVGIPSELLSRIFTPFYRVKDTATQRKEPSTGLGLSITKRLVEAQGGTVHVTSETGKGSTFTVSLPKAEAT